MRGNSPGMAQWGQGGSLKPQSLQPRASEMAILLPCLPSVEGSWATLDNGAWLLPSSWALVINAQKLPLPAQFIKCPAAGCRARDLAHQELNLPDKEQPLSLSQGDV